MTLEELAQSQLDPLAAGYLGMSAGDSAARNVEAWAALHLRPRMLRDLSRLSTVTSVLGERTFAPIMVAPMAVHRLFSPQGELATARGAARAGAVLVVSMAASTALEHIAAAAPLGSRWMQVLVLRDRGLTRSVCERARECGYRAVVVTVDCPPVAVAPPPTQRPTNVGLPLPNYAPEAEHPDLAEFASQYDPTLTFDDLAEIRAWTGLPLVVKGVMRGDDARQCVEHGADALAVSNHGGRLLTGCIPTARALPEVVDAVGGSAEVYVDGGIRSGADVMKALALGANAVLIGRPVLWGLAVDADDGVASVLSDLRDELVRTMALCGVDDLSKVPRDLVTGPGHQ
jgi:4-hydroxymandelate oxidase